jgi:hypothetical protein
MTLNVFTGIELTSNEFLNFLKNLKPDFNSINKKEDIEKVLNLNLKNKINSLYKKEDEILLNGFLKNHYIELNQIKDNLFIGYKIDSNYKNKFLFKYNKEIFKNLLNLIDNSLNNQVKIIFKN